MKTNVNVFFEYLSHFRPQSSGYKTVSDFVLGKLESLQYSRSADTVLTEGVPRRASRHCFCFFSTLLVHQLKILRQHQSRRRFHFSVRFSPRKRFKASLTLAKWFSYKIAQQNADPIFFCAKNSTIGRNL